MLKIILELKSLYLIIERMKTSVLKNSTTKYGSKINNFTKVFLFPPECTTACAVYRVYRLYRLYNQLLVSSAPKL